MIQNELLDKIKKLDKDSKKIGQPEGLVIPLMDHQKTMLYKCLSIEKTNKNNSFPFGILADRAGSGKTAVLIGLVLSDRIIFGKSKTLIVVPQNIHSQWISEIKKFTAGKEQIRVKSYINYSDISEIYSRTFSKDLEKDDNEIYITTPVFYETINNAFYKENSVKNVFRRVIFDEIDTSSVFLDSIYSKNKTLSEACKKSNTVGIHDYSKKTSERYIFNMSWFVSASFDNMIKTGGSHRGKKFFTFLGETITEDYFLNSVCLCEADFVEESNFKIEKFLHEKVKCVDPLLDKLWGCVSPDLIDICNSLSWKRANIPTVRGDEEHGICYDTRDVILKTVYHYKYKIEKLNEEIEFIKNKIKNESENIDNVLRSHIISLEKETSFYKDLVKVYHDKMCDENCSFEENECSKCITGNVNTTAINEEESKISRFLELVKNNKDKKILIFSDISGGFEVLKREISVNVDSDIVYEELEGGSPGEISAQINRYKNGGTSILFIDSSSQGCGINLENTDIIIMIHKTKEVLFNQIIGRAQRPHRKSRLEVYELLNENEFI
jgi:hypothetical protein